jgi:Domain of unknown function (DUF4328)
MVGNALYALFGYCAIALIFGGDHAHLFTTASDGSPHFSGRLVAIQLASLPLSLVGLAFTALFIAWVYKAGEFAQAMGWPATRGRTLGAFSVLIPIVNLWWPYEAIRDAYPPGSDHSLLLRWWLSYLVVPFATIVVVFFVALLGTSTLIWVTVALAALPLSVPVILGWKLVDDLDLARIAANRPG